MSTIMASRAIVDKTTESYYISYRRNLIAVGVMWAIFVVCLAIIDVVVVAQPQWIGDTAASPGVGFFGLIRYCRLHSGGSSLACDGRMDDFSTILNDSFRAATVLSGLAALLTLITIVLMILFFFVSAPEWIFRVCGILLTVTCLFSLLGCVIFPSGWDDAVVRSVCGSAAGKFHPGTCGIRWAFVLAILSIFDALVLAILAFVLASRMAKMRPMADAAAAAAAAGGGAGAGAGIGGTNGAKHSRPQSEVNSAYVDDFYHNSRLTTASLGDNMAGDNFTDISFNTRRSKNFQL